MYTLAWLVLLVHPAVLPEGSPAREPWTQTPLNICCAADASSCSVRAEVQALQPASILQALPGAAPASCCAPPATRGPARRLVRQVRVPQLLLPLPVLLWHQMLGSSPPASMHSSGTGCCGCCRCCCCVLWPAMVPHLLPAADIPKRTDPLGSLLLTSGQRLLLLAAADGVGVTSLGVAGISPGMSAITWLQAASKRLFRGAACCTGRP